MHVEVVPAGAGDRGTLANLFELYLYDFSGVDGAQIGADGRFSSPGMLDVYWGDPQRHPLLIRSDGRLAGFALVKRGSALAGDLTAMDLAEFFVLRGQRRSGVGRHAANAILRRWPGRWVVRVLANNPEALAFWQRAIADSTGGRFVRDTVKQTNHSPPRDWVVFRFTTAAI
jgi:predicted acetyltransferase